MCNIPYPAQWFRSIVYSCDTCTFSGIITKGHEDSNPACQSCRTFPMGKWEKEK